MKLRITKGRIALVVVLLPVLFVLNAGPILYGTMRFRFPPYVVYKAIVDPIDNVLKGTPLHTPFIKYLHWWFDRAKDK